jgi:SAM-dependent methyltransferase
MTLPPNPEKISSYFEERARTHGNTPRGADWNSTEAQEIRFSQLLRIVKPNEFFQILDYGSGYGALASFLQRHGYDFRYTGFDLLERVIEETKILFSDVPAIQFTSDPTNLPGVDYTVASGIFNIRLDISDQEWTEYVIRTLDKFNDLSQKGFAFNLLTSYSDPEYTRPDLYYADPCFYFDYCKRHYSRNVALLHDYQLYDFTILVRK